jgi:hypothetical protein
VDVVLSKYLLQNLGQMDTILLTGILGHTVGMCTDGECTVCEARNNILKVHEEINSVILDLPRMVGTDVCFLVPVAS